MGTASFFKTERRTKDDPEIVLKDPSKSSALKCAEYSREFGAVDNFSRLIRTKATQIRRLTIVIKFMKTLTPLKGLEDLSNFQLHTYWACFLFIVNYK